MRSREWSPEKLRAPARVTHPELDAATHDPKKGLPTCQRQLGNMRRTLGSPLDSRWLTSRRCKGRSGLSCWSSCRCRHRSKRKRAAAIVGGVLPTSRPDLDNFIKSALDAINTIVVVDDSQSPKLAARHFQQAGRQAVNCASTIWQGLAVEVERRGAAMVLADVERAAAVVGGRLLAGSSPRRLRLLSSFADAAGSSWPSGAPVLRGVDVRIHIFSDRGLRLSRPASIPA